jgi:hypothetical protein
VSPLSGNPFGKVSVSSSKTFTKLSVYLKATEKSPIKKDGALKIKHKMFSKNAVSAPAFARKGTIF